MRNLPKEFVPVSETNGVCPDGHVAMIWGLSDPVVNIFGPRQEAVVGYLPKDMVEKMIPA